MPVRDHACQHDRISELPLVTESARVVDREALDRDRRQGARRAARRALDDAGVLDEYDAHVGDPLQWDRLRERLAADGRGTLARRIAVLGERVDRPSPMLVRAKFEADEQFDYLAGQYVGLRYDGTSRAYSIANSPTREGVEICVRRVPGGRLSPAICERLSVGDRVTLRGPYGELVLGEATTRDPVFLATGTGVAPLKGMIEYLFDAGRDEVDGHERDVWLFLGAAWRDDLPYRDWFRDLASERDNFQFVPCLSREGYLADWDGESDYVQHVLLKHVDGDALTEPLGEELERWIRQDPVSGTDRRIDPGNVDVYACGINAMVYSLVTAVERVGVPESRIDAEGFG